MEEEKYYGIHDYIIDETQFPLFKAGKTGNEFKSSIFEIGPKIKWQLFAYPNGRIEADKHSVMLSLCLSSYPKHLTNILIYYQLHCIETGSNFSQIKSFKKVDDSASWFRAVFHNDELINLPNTIKKLQFQCVINILRIQSDQNILFQYPFDIDFKTKRQFICDWKIKDNMLDKFKNAKHGKFLSDNVIHDNMWSLQCAPNGYRMNDDGSVRLFIQLCALPRGIKSIRLTRKLICLNKEKFVERKDTKDQPWGYNLDNSIIMRQNSGWGKQALIRNDIIHLNQINFRAIITVIGYTTDKGEKIDLPPIETPITVTPTPRTTRKRKRDNNDNDNQQDNDWKMIKVKKVKVDNKCYGKYEWILTNDLLLKFKNAKYRKVWKSEEFKVNNLNWCIEVYPAGHNKSDKDNQSMMIFLTMITKLNKEISKMMVCWTLYIKPTGTSFTTISQFTEKNNSFGFCGGILTIKELKTLQNTFKHKVTIGAKLTILNTIDTKDLKTKIFKQIYPLSIKNNDDGISGDNNPYFNKKCSFEWKINGDLLKKFKNAPNGKSFESSSFNGNLWNLRCCPNGEKKEDKGYIDLILQLNALPQNISKMRTIFTLKCIETETNSLIIHNYNINKSAAGWNNKLLKIDDIYNKDSLTFCVFIDINTFYDNLNKRLSI